MSTTALTRQVKVAGVLTNATSCTCAVVRTDTSATVANVATHPSTGIYTFTVTDPALDLTYTFTVTTVYGGETYVNAVTVYGPVAEGGTGYAMTLKQLALEVLEYAGKSTANADLTGVGASVEMYTQAKRWVNYAAQEMADFGPWPWMVRSFVDVSLTVGAYAFDLPADVHRLAGPPNYSDSIYLWQPATLDELKRLRNASTNSGTAYVWAMGYDHADKVHQLLVWPPVASAATVSVPYVRILEQVTAETGSFPIPPNLHPILSLGALAQWEERASKNWASGPRQQFDRRVAEAFKHATDAAGVPMAMKAHSHMGMQGVSRQDWTISTLP